MSDKGLKKKHRKIVVIVFFCLVISAGLSFFIINDKLQKADMGAAVIYDMNGEEIERLDKAWTSGLASKSMIMNDIITDSIVRELYEELQANGMSEEKIEEGLNLDGWKIYTTIDVELQDCLNQYYQDSSNFTATGKEMDWSEIPPSSMVIMDYRGCIRAIAGGSGQWGDVNRATNKLYQVGSTIKPVSIYAPAVANKLINYSTLCEDTPGNTVVRGKNIQWPSNSDDHYDGQVTVAYALETSKNTVPVNLGMQMGIDYIYKYLKNTYFSALEDEKDKQLAALALGYFERGISLDELAASYEPFGNGGNYYSPAIYTKVIDKDEKVIIKKSREPQKIMDKETAYIMNRLLVNNVSGKDGIASGAQIEGLEVAGKTGTVANEVTDVRKLFVGMTPEYIAGVQVGYDEKDIPLPGDYKQPINIWQEFMGSIQPGIKEFEKSKEVIEKEFCEVTGKIKGEYCKEIQAGYYTKDNMPEICTECK